MKRAKKISMNKDGSLCSGYKVFPNGKKCKGCIDCDFLQSKESVREVFERTHSTVTVRKGFDLEAFLKGKKKR